MEFRFEDILKNIIPGMIFLSGIVLFVLANYNYDSLTKVLSSDLKEYTEFLVLFLLVGSYLLGYVIDAISSLIEHYIIHEFFGTPSYNLLMGKGARIKLLTFKSIIENLKKEFNKTTDFDFTKDTKKDKKIASDLFKYANILKNKNANEEVSKLTNEYYYSYIFSRNFFFSVLFSIILVVIKYYNSLSFVYYIVFAITLCVLLIRRRDRSYYYSRQVLIASNLNLTLSDSDIK